MLPVGYRANKFVVGLTNNDTALHAPVLWSYTLCGQYPGAVPDGATVTVHCTDIYNRGLRFRYVIVQFPLINDQMNVCEIEVFAIGMCCISLSMTPHSLYRVLRQEFDNGYLKC